MGVFRVADSILVSEGFGSLAIVEAAGSVGEGTQCVATLGLTSRIVVSVFCLSNSTVTLGFEGSRVSN